MNPIAITLGDAAGIGPEIVVKTLREPGVMQVHPAFIVGPADAVERAVQLWAPGMRVRRIGTVGQHQSDGDVIDVMDVGILPEDLQFGQIDARAGLAAYQAIERAIELAMAGEISAICTAPIHKGALAAAGITYPGHTEILTDQSGSKDTAMMLVNAMLRTMLVTVHCSLQDAIAMLDVERELRIIRLADRTLREMGIGEPRLAVAGLNPHAGEGGLFGNEDIDVIAPAVALAKAEGINVSGPYPGDTVFMHARRGLFDLVIAQYHDQGLIPIKLLGVEDGVNVTAGLPFVRTSPDHGTAFDIAGRGLADPSSLKTALATAHQLARNRLVTRPTYR